MRLIGTFSTLPPSYFFDVLICSVLDAALVETADLLSRTPMDAEETVGHMLAGGTSVAGTREETTAHDVRACSIGKMPCE